MPSEMTVVPAPATAAFGAVSIESTQESPPSTPCGADLITGGAAAALALMEGSDSAASSAAAHDQTAAGELGTSQVQSYVDTDQANAQALSNPDVIST